MRKTCCHCTTNWLMRAVQLVFCCLCTLHFLQDMAGLRFSAVAMACVLSTVSAVPNGLGMTPPLAWSSWNYFVSDTDVRMFV